MFNVECSNVVWHINLIFVAKTATFAKRLRSLGHIGASKQRFCGALFYDSLSLALLRKYSE
jgi:hypothetical protein